MSTVNISLLPEHVQLIDSFVKKYGYSSRSEFVRSILRLVDRKPELVDQATEVPFFDTPPHQSRKQILEDFRKTHKYSEAFLRDLEEGLKNSDYFTD